MVVDASIWVAVLVPRDAHHAVCRAWIGRELTAGATLLIPVHALAEVAGAVARRTGYPAEGRRALATLLAVLRLQLMPVDAVLARSAAEAAADHLLRGADALYAAMAHLLGLPLITLDAELRRRAAGLVRVVAP
jgi:predicted nucleic acid-binding protein